MTAPLGMHLGFLESNNWKLSNNIGKSPNGAQEAIQQNKRLKWGRRRAWWIPRQ